MKSKWSLVGLMALALAGAPVLADVWDASPTDQDDSSATDNEIVHGTVQTHDLAAQAATADQDWYKIPSFAFSSHEFVVDGPTGDVTNGLDLNRVTAAGAVLTAGAGLPGGSNYAQSVRWQNVSTTSTTEYVRVSGAQCTTACTTVDQYTARYFETTAVISRYNNSGTQTTVMILANPNDYTISGTAWFFTTTAGVLAGSQPFVISSRDVDVFSTASQAPGVSGFIIITHNGRYGDLHGKAVALEPATGFSFDTPLTYKAK
jgi:hypothetical protein